MKTLLRLTFAAVAFVFPAAALADIPLPSPVPSGLPGRTATNLRGQHDDLVSRHDRVDSEVDQQNARCSAVRADDAAQVSACEDSQRRILSEIKQYQADLDAYERALRAVPATVKAGSAPADVHASSVAAQINALCGQLNSDLDRMSKVDLKIVQTQVDALSKLTLTVPVAVLIGGSYEASDPPEDVLDEAREALRQVAETTEQIDELNGKRAWTEQERQWVLDHIYVATPEADYGVSTSDRTAHGQTAFSELRKMPAFQGCAAGRQGRKYIPQLPRSS